MGVAVGTYRSYSFGTLITPTDYLVGGVFTHQWLATQNHGTNYLDIQSTGWAIEDDETNTRSYHGSIVKLRPENYARQFSGIGYVKIMMKDGTTKYIYAPYTTSSARTAEYIAKAAIADKDGDYTAQQKEFLQKYIVTSVGVTTGRLNASTMANFDLHGLNAGASKTLTTNVTLNGPYIVLEYNSYYNMLVTFNYTNNGVTVNEEAYLPAGSTVHKQFFDVFRTHNGSLGKGKFDTSKSFTLNSITFKNVDNKTGAANLVDFTSFSFTLEDKGYDLEDKDYKLIGQSIYLTKEFNGYDVTIGAHLGLGGSLTYLAKSGIAEYKYTTTTTEGSSWNQKTITTEYVGIGVAPSGTTILRKGTSSKPAVLGGDGVNLINNYDKGRQIQQAWYGDIGSEYKRGTYNNNSQWPYNPVQAGDKGDNASQIIDYEIGENYIYVKARAMDWAMPNDTPVTTKSYMENWYRINDDGTVRVDNAFVDWNGFKDTGGFTSNELPAFYTVQSMNYFVSNTSMSKDDAWTGSLKYYNPGSWNEGNDTAVHQFRAPQEGTDVNGNSLNKGKFENWFAWASGNTESALAIGCYMPNVEKFTSGRTEKTSAVKMVQKPKWGSETTTTYDKNNNASSSSVKNLSGMDPAAYNEMSCYVQNCSYTAPGTSYKMAEYVPISYSYVIMVDTVTNIRANFQVLESSGTLTNEGLNAWLREGQS